MLGIRPRIGRAYHKTGKTDDPLGHLTGEFWKELFRSDAEMQRKLNEGDATMRRRFRTACMYIAGKRGDVDPAEEAKYRARLTLGDNLMALAKLHEIIDRPMAFHMAVSSRDGSTWLVGERRALT